MARHFTRKPELVPNTPRPIADKPGNILTGPQPPNTLRPLKDHTYLKGPPSMHHPPVDSRRQRANYRPGYLYRPFKIGKQIIKILPNILRSRDNKKMKFGQLIECNMRNIFLYSLFLFYVQAEGY